MSKRKKHKARPTPRKPDASTPNAGKGGYAVGYGRPPVDKQFKSGVSANPKGRPAGRPNTKSTVVRVINETVPVRDGDKTRQMTKLEALLQAHTLKAMKGDARSASIVIGVVTKMGLLGEPETETLTALSTEDEAILADYLRRHAGSGDSKPANDGEAR